MKETGAVFGGEHSGHYYFRDNYRADSGILAMLVLLQVLSEDGRPLSELRKDFEPYSQSGEINFEVADQARVDRHVAEAFDGETDHPRRANRCRGRTAGSICGRRTRSRCCD